MRILLCCVTLAVLLVPSARAGWIPGGTRVSASYPDDVSAASDGAGGVIVCWADNRYGSPQIFAQRLTVDGEIAAGWPADGFQVCATGTPQTNQRVVADGTGGAVIAWDSYSAGVPVVYATRITGDGAVSPGWPELGVALAGSGLCSVVQLRASIVADGAGGAIVCISSYLVGGHGCPTGYTTLRAQHITGGGIPDSSSVFVHFGAVSGPTIAGDVAGGAILVLWDRVSVPPYAVRLTANGRVRSGWPSNVTSERVQWTYPASDGVGGAFFAFSRRGPIGEPSKVYAQHLLPDGTRALGWPEVGLQAVVTGTYDRGAWTIFPDGAGGAVIGWVETGGGTGVDLHAQRIMPDGTPAPGWGADGVPMCTAPGDQNRAALVPDGQGGAWGAWIDQRSGSDELFALRISGKGTLEPGWAADGTLISPTPTWPAPVIVPSDDATAIVVWLDRRDPMRGIYAQRLVGDGPVPVAMDLVSAEPSSGFVKTTGMIADGAGLLVTVYRRSDGGEPSSIATVFPDGTGRIEHVDRDVEPGTRYGYQLGARDGDREILTREIWVSVPDRFVLGLEPIHPNPSTGALTVAFRLPVTDDAVLELLDLAGRSIAMREVGSLGVGRKTVEFPEARRLAPGLYVARLTQGTRSLSVKFCVMR